MALTLATRVANQHGNWRFYTGGVGVSDNDVLLDLDGEGSIEVVLLSRAGAVDVFGSIDGANFASSALALEDMTATAPATRVIVTTANKPARITQPGFKTLRFMQNGATGTTLEVAVRVAP